MTVLRYIQPKIKGMSNGLFANWMPTNRVEVGDFGVVRNGQFDRMGSIRDFGAEFEIEDDPAARTELEYKDKFHINVGATAAAAASGGNSTKVTVSSRGRGSFLYHLSNVRQQRPANMRQFNEEVARVLIGSDFDFPKDGVLITELQIATKATIIVSDQDDGQLQLTASFKPAGGAYLSGADGKIEAGESYGNFFKWLAKDELTSLIKIVIPKISPVDGPGPGSGAGLMASNFQKVRDWMKERRIGASHLRITYRPSPENDGTIVAFEGQTAVYQTVLHDMSAQEMQQTMEIPLEADIGSPFNMEIEEQEFGAQAEENRGFREASG